MAKITGNFSDVQRDVRPEQVEDRLTQIILAYVRNGTRLPNFMPQNEVDAARWWIDMQEKSDPRFDAPRKVSMPGDEGFRWESPYVRRIEKTLEKFLSLSERQKLIIVNAKQNGVYWRGDDMPFFLNVIREHELMKQMGVEKYRAYALNKMKSLKLGADRKIEDDEARAEREAIQSESSIEF